MYVTVLLVVLAVLGAAATYLVVHKRRSQEPVTSASPTPAPAAAAYSSPSPPVPVPRHNPGLGSYYTDMMRRMVRAGVDRSAFSAPLTYHKDIDGIVHGDPDCGGVVGSVTVDKRSPLSMPVNRTCSCADEHGYSASGVSHLLNNGERLLGLRRRLQELPKSRKPETMVENLRTVEDTLLTAVESSEYSKPELAGLQASIRQQLEEVARDLRKEICTPAAQASFLETLAVREVISSMGSRSFTQKETRILAPRDYDSPRIASSLSSAWRQVRPQMSAAEARAKVLKDALRSLSQTAGPLPAQLEFEPSRPRGADESFREWVVASWLQACEDLLGGFVDSWEQEIVSRSTEPSSVLLGFEKRPYSHRSEVGVAIEVFRLPGDEVVCFVPKSVASWFTKQGVSLAKSNGVQRVDGETVTFEEAETAAALWSPGDSGALSSLSKALETAQVV